MYGILVCITILLLISSIHPAIMSSDYTKLTKNGKRLLTLTLTGTVALLWFTFFATTTTILSQTPDAKHSKQPWRIIYKNDIKADIKIESCSGWLTPVTPKDIVSKSDFNQFMQGLPIPGINTDEANINITAKNDVDETTKKVTLPKDNIIETWPKGMKPNKSKGQITKIE